MSDLVARIRAAQTEGELISEPRLKEIELHIHRARTTDDIWITPADALSMIAEIRRLKHEHVTDTVQIAMLRTLLGDKAPPGAGEDRGPT